MVQELTGDAAEQRSLQPTEPTGSTDDELDGELVRGLGDLVRRRMVRRLHDQFGVDPACGELGDTIAVAELADTISLSALAQGAGERELAEAVWAAGARAVGWGSSEVHRLAKDLVSSGAPDAIEAMRTSALGPPASP